MQDPLKTLLFATSRKRKKSTTPTAPNPVPLPNSQSPDELPAENPPKKEKLDDYDDIQFFNHSLAQSMVKPKKQKKKASKAQLQLEQTQRERKAHKIFVWGTDIPPPVGTFEEMGLPPKILDNLRALELSVPTSVQMQTIPVMLKGRECLGSAPTGSGKTLAFVLPLLASLGPTPPTLPPLTPRAVVLAPTRELATQIYNETLRVGKGFGLRVHLLVKVNKLRAGAKFDLVVTTPKRLLSALGGRRGEALSLGQLHWLVVDESDKLFQSGERESEGFRGQLALVHKAAAGSPHLRRAFFSATFSDPVQDWCKVYLDNVITISIGKRNTSAETVSQEFIFAGSEQGKLTAMRSLIANGLEPPVLIFVQSKDRTEQLGVELGTLVDPGRVAFLHGGVPDEKRDGAVLGFREGRVWFLVCTELMGRGVDFRGVRVVVNWDCPLSRAAYIHQIGRTGRAGRKGRAITMLTESDRPLLWPLASVATQAGVELPVFMQNLKRPSWHKKLMARKKGIGPRAPKRDRISKEERFQEKKHKKKKPKASVTVQS